MRTTVAERQAIPNGTTGFFSSIARYYSAFLETDFKKDRLPKRRIESRDRKGRVVGISLQKYPSLEKELWDALSKPIKAGLEIRVRRGKYRSKIPQTIQDVISRQIESVSTEELLVVLTSIISGALKQAKENDADPEIYREAFLSNVRSAISRSIVSPLLQHMESFFERTENKPLENMLDFENEICDLLLAEFEDHCGEGLSALLVDLQADSLIELVNDLFVDLPIKEKLRTFFESFASGDLYIDLSELKLTQQVIDNIELYLYIGTLSFEKHNYPLFYIPMTLEESSTQYIIKSEPQLFINKKAIDFITQEIGREEGRTIPSIIKERIYYLDAENAPIDRLQGIIDKVSNALSLKSEVSFHISRSQSASSSKVSLANRLSLSLFDKSDESLLNDYEAILTGIETDSVVVDAFVAMLNKFMLSNPVDVTLDIDKEWDSTPFVERLVFDSPIPLAEEQRKILSALEKDDVKFICVEGPPGTGKSHTCSAIAFNTILSGRSLLFLSDKKEALDVVEDKLNSVLQKIRMGDDFQNPILRLGKAGSNYNQVLKNATVEKIKTQLKIAGAQEEKLQAEHQQEKKSLKEQLQKTSEIYSSINLATICEQIRLEEEFLNEFSELDDPNSLALFNDFIEMRLQLKPYGAELHTTLKKHPEGLAALATISKIASTMQEKNPVEVLQQFRALKSSEIETLTRLVDQIENARKPVIGYFLSGKKLRKFSQELRNKYGFETLKPHKKLPLIRQHIKFLNVLEENLHSVGVDKSNFPLAQFMGQLDSVLTFRDMQTEIMSTQTALKAIADDAFPFEDIRTDPLGAIFDETHPQAEMMDRYSSIYSKLREISRKYESLPEFDYLASKTKIESLNSQRLAKIIDKRVVDFFYQQKADVKTLAKIIRNKSKFPTEKFANLRKAFPCIIAGLRDFADFIPLEHEVFDVLVIDEASQVSIAQALPALIRAKKVVVFGDRRQFGNVKTTNASLETNTAYMQDLLKTFRDDYGEDVSALERAKVFNIKSSLMDFFEMTANFTIQLRKHFRGYPEMISFSSENFYSGNLQPMKIRGKAISEVLEFQPVEHDGKYDLAKNTNELEAKHILKQLKTLLQEDSPPSVGIITPHTNQQTYISRLIHQAPEGKEILSRLRLKVMTFDSCQGEERDWIFYSFVATEEKDRLSNVFPRDLTADDDIIDHNLRMQRLNVGFSRGKEKLIFVHSKPIERYRSALSAVLLHYQRVLSTAASMPTIDDVDPKSPAEAKLLHIITQCPVFDQYGKNLEVLAQFEVGRYLKNLDPTYDHPDYRVDFLLRLTVDKTVHQIIIEYDGFDYHFRKDEEVNAGNWENYLTEADIEREKVLESFGYKMIRVNRFNLGDSPVKTLNERIKKMLTLMMNGNKAHALVDQIAKESQRAHEGIKNGTHKHCKKCDQIKPLKAFEDPKTSSGYGRYCMACKKKPVKRKTRSTRSSYKWRYSRD